MHLPSEDILYALTQLGLPANATLSERDEVLPFAKQYAYATRERIKHLEKFTKFFLARAQLAADHDSFETVRKYYHREAMALHPDRNHSDPGAEDQLKAINVAYAAVEAVYKEARDYFKLSAEEREQILFEARKATERERAAALGTPSSHTVRMDYPGEAKAATPAAAQTEKPRGHHEAPLKYFAASLPRYIRTSRLFYLGRDAIVGSRLIKSAGSHGMIYDVIMLPEREFMRARLRLSLEGYGVQELTMSKLTPPYILMDVKELQIPPNTEDPEAFARAHFEIQFSFLKSSDNL